MRCTLDAPLVASMPQCCQKVTGLEHGHVLAMWLLNSSFAQIAAQGVIFCMIAGRQGGQSSDRSQELLIVLTGQCC